MIRIPGWYLLLEIAAFCLFCSHYGFGTVFLAYLAPSFLGAIVIAFQSRTAFFSLQTRLAEGREPGPQVLNTAAGFIAGLLLIVPFLATRVLGVLLLLPGTRQLLLFMVQAWIFKRFAGTIFRNAGAGPGFNASFRTFRYDGQGFAEETRVERDAEVIDVTPLEIERK